MSGADSANSAPLLRAAIEWGVTPSPSQPSRVREFLMLNFEPILNQEDADRVGIASHELIENILKYSNGGTGSFELTISRRNGEGHVSIRTRNQVTAERLRHAEAQIRRIRVASNPGIVYDELVASSPGREGSGLGLARIRVEADMDVGCLADELALTITVEGKVTIRGSVC